MKTKKSFTISVPPLAEKDPAGVFASFVSKTKYEDLTDKTIKEYKKKLLDTLAVFIGGVAVDSEQVVKMLSYFRDKGGKPEARLIRYGDKLPLLSAAFINGVACRVLDLGDFEIEVDHFSEHIIPTILSVADAIDGIDGKAFLTAFAVSSEVTARIGHACYGMSYGYFIGEIPTKLPPIEQWGVVCGVSKLMGFDSEKTWDAIGHAYSILSSTDAQATAEGTYMKSIEHGFTALNSILCCELAKAGIRGTRNVFLGPKGFIANFYPFKNDPDLLTAEIGTRWFDVVSQKKFACCAQSHSAVQAAMDIVDEHEIPLDEIETVFCEVPPGFSPVITPEKWNPTTAGMARFSLPYAIATGLIKGKVFVDDFTDKELKRADIHLLMAKVKADMDDTLPMFGSRATITTKDGRTFSKEQPDIPGSAQFPMSWDDIVKKFHLIISSLNIPISKERATEIVDTVDHIEELKNVKSLIDLMIW